MQMNVDPSGDPELSEPGCVHNTDVSRLLPAAALSWGSAIDHPATELDNIVPILDNQVEGRDHSSARKLVVRIEEDQPRSIRLFDQSDSGVKRASVLFAFYQNQAGMVALVLFDQSDTAVTAAVVVAEDADARQVDREGEDGPESGIEIMVLVEDREEDGDFAVGRAGRICKPVGKDRGEVVKTEGGESEEGEHDKEANRRRGKNAMMSPAMRCEDV
jgi:hypothetical protein